MQYVSLESYILDLDLDLDLDNYVAGPLQHIGDGRELGMVISPAARRLS